MTVRELIRKLEEYPEDEPVYHWVYMGGDDRLIEIFEVEHTEENDYYREVGIVLK